MSESVVIVRDLRKKFCRSLKKSLWYGLADILADLNPRHGATPGSPGCMTVPPLRKDEFWAVNNISFELRKGECIGLIGHNGAGKTTLLKMLNGLLKPDAGRIEMRGRVGALIALGAGFNPILSGRENIYVNGAVLGLTKAEVDAKLDEIIDYAEIRDFIDAPVQTYSSGMAVRLGFAIAVKSKPDILLLDEVLAVGDAGFHAKCLNTLSEFRESGTAFILVSHNMHMIARYCDSVLYMKHGVVAHSGRADQGINAYLSDMVSDGTNDHGQTDWARVYGSGKMAFTGASFHDEDGEKITQTKPGRSFSLRIQYERRDSEVKSCIVDLVARDAEGIVLFQGTSADFGCRLESLGRRGQFVIHFKECPVNVPRMQFSFAAMSERSAEVYDWKRYVTLKISPNPKLSGKLALALSWHHRADLVDLSPTGGRSDSVVTVS